ncbi:BsuPI-related putative proteinase inhibitor [Heyndrickxia vini]|uniref:Intracellular proteinase inhibitor BsuPI domain-containing protein n=1 Tax=Heyndrickxia vini TaxID=1476025 RepID=A0ABX7E1L2_9BACI|nr:BsuPI-related putative proteinase inhibitor [Heyndrickxia vini]QQZ08242.1 hypothetical protein I5776_14320 [Heyndrickxia vini]
MKKLIVFFSILIITCLIPLQAKAERDGLSMISWNVHLTPKPNQLDIELIVSNTGDSDVTLEFPTSQYYDYSIYDASNKEIFRFSKGRYFLQAFQYVNLPKGTNKVWKSSWDYTSQGKKQEEGMYMVKATLLPTKINGERPTKRYVASTEFSIPLFKDFTIKKLDNGVIVTGETFHPLTGYSYSVDDGHNELIKKTPLNTKNEEFALELPIQTHSYILTIYNEEGKPVYVGSF